jgi:tetratricopeptide (TPR) repeat protein
MGIGSDWSRDLADAVRGCEKLGPDARLALIRRAAADLKERAIPFLLSRLAANEAESACVHECMKREDSEKMAEGVIEHVKQPRTDGEARTLGWAYLRVNRPRDALRVLTARHADEQAIREITEKAVKHLTGLLSEGHFQEAGETAGEFASAGPTEARFLYAQAEALRRLGKEKEAETLHAKALGLNPDQEAPHYLAADMLEDLGLDELSRREWERILKIPPADDVYDINAYLHLGRILTRQRQHERAADNLEKALTLYRAKRAGGGTGYGLVGAKEEDLAKEIASLRKKGDRGTFAAGKEGEQVRLRVRAMVKDGKLAELKRALSATSCSLAMNVEPFGLRVLDLDECEVAYDPASGEVSVLLGKSPCCRPQKIRIPDGDKKPTIAVSSLDCIYIFEADTGSGKVRKTARYEKDYSVKAEPDEGIRGYRAAPVKIGDRECSWDDLLQGTILDYVPPVLELRLEGKQPDGSPRTVEFRIPIDEGSMDLTDAPAKEK